jgi:hypothetical protein
MPPCHPSTIKRIIILLAILATSCSPNANLIVHHPLPFSSSIKTPFQSIVDLNSSKLKVLDETIITSTPGATLTPTATPTSTRFPLKAVVIAEVGWMGTSSSTTTDEWIELYNNTTAPVSLEGWHLRSYQYNATTKTFVLNLDIALSGTISVNSGSGDANDTSGFFLLERREQAVNDITGDLIYGGTKYLSNSGEILLLCSTFNIDANNCSINTKNQVVDYVNASLTTTGSVNPWPAGSSSTYGSMERKNLYSDEDTTWFTHTGANPHWGRDANNNAIKGTPKHGNWAFTVTATPSTRSTAIPTRTAKPTRLPTSTPTSTPLAPIAPFLVSPNDGISLNNRHPRFSWNLIEEANSYILEVSTSENFSNKVIYVNLTGSSYTSSSDFNANKMYYWRVRARVKSLLGNSNFNHWQSAFFPEASVSD